MNWGAYVGFELAHLFEHLLEVGGIGVTDALEDGEGGRSGDEI
jgi:hypothetical protein